MECDDLQIKAQQLIGQFNDSASDLRSSIGSDAIEALKSFIECLKQHPSLMPLTQHRPPEGHVQLRSFIQNQIKWAEETIDQITREINSRQGQDS